MLKKGQEAQWWYSIDYFGGNLRQSIFAVRNRFRPRKPNCVFQSEPWPDYRRIAVPEAYFIERSEYVPNDNVPLRWTQANLWLALKLMKSTAA